MSDDGSVIREATPNDVAAVGSLIRALALYEKEPDQAIATDEQLREALFRVGSHVHCHVVEVDGEIVALALWFLNFSSWLGTAGVYLEDLFVDPDYRGRGYGLELMRTLARTCAERGYSRLQWSVLDWNAPSIDFYRSLGAVAMDEWTVYRLEGDALDRFAR